MGHAHYPTARNVAASARGRGIPLVAACPTSDALMLGSWPQKVRIKSLQRQEKKEMLADEKLELMKTS